jgi:drug/metabolite transporter (DMT)-like permease
MNLNLEKLAARAAPVIFVVLWSTGFVATKYVLHNAEPLTYLAIRMAVVVGLMAVIVAIARPRWPDGMGVAHSVIAGILVHGFYLGGTAVAIAHSIPAGLSALIPGLQPILTSTLANRWLGERVTPLQWTGLLLGLAGVVLILHNRPMSGEAGWGWLASGVSLVSITLARCTKGAIAARSTGAPVISCSTSRSRFSSPPAHGCSRATSCTGPASSCWRWPGSR